MALSRVKVWIAGEVLTASDLNSEFNNIVDNASSLFSPATGTLDMDGNIIVLDADADSSIFVTTDDRFDVRVGGSTLFRFDGTVATPVNGFDFIAAATANQIRLGAFGSDTNINLALRPKGSTGVVRLEDGNGNEVLVAGVATASAVNELTVTNAATAGSPRLGVTGGDTDVSLELRPKAAGRIFLADGNGKPLLATSPGVVGAVNHINVQNAATANAPQIQGAGTDANVDITLVPKGSGIVTVSSPLTVTGAVSLSAALSTTAAINLDAWQTIASVAGTTDIGAATSNLVAISGTETITGLGTAADGVWRVVRSTGVWSIAFSANIVGPNGQTSGSFSTAVGRLWLAISQGAGVWNFGTLGLFQASQTSMEAATELSGAVTPLRQHFHPGHPKAWLYYKQTDTIAIGADYGVTSVTDDAAGTFTPTFDTAFSGENYIAVGMTSTIGAAEAIMAKATTSDTYTTTAIKLLTPTLAGTPTDYDHDFVIFCGDQ